MHKEFERRGFLICGIFDNDEKKAGKKVGRFDVMHVRDLPAFVGDHDIDIGVIAVPADAAQGVADTLISAGVRGLLNPTLTHVIAPARVAVTEARVVASLMELSHAIISLP